MGRWDALTQRQSDFVLRLAEVSSREEIESFSNRGMNEGELFPIGVDATNENKLYGVPKEIVFYRSLEHLGFICLYVRDAQGAKLYYDLGVYKLVYDYSDYHKKPKFQQKLEDFGYEFTHQQNALGKISGMVASGVVGAVVGALVGRLIN